MTFTLPDGTTKEITAEKLNLVRNAFRSGNFPPPPPGWEKEVWEAGCLKAIVPRPRLSEIITFSSPTA
jgi:hypothetical protein